MSKQESFTGGFKKLKQDLAHMTLRQKWDHLWTYYRYWMVAIFAVIMFIALMITTALNRSTRTTVAGVSVNVTISEQGHAYMTDQLFDQVKTGSGREKIYLQTVYLQDPQTTTDYNNNYYALTNLVTLISDKQLDYLILDEMGLRGLMSYEPFMDLREVFPQEMLDSLGSRLVNVEMGETKQAIPALIDISDLPFIKENAKYKAPIYFAVLSNSPRLEATVKAWEHLNAWQPTAE